MTSLSKHLLQRHYADSPHPYRLYEQRVDSLLAPGDTLLDAGCGRTVPVLKKYLGRAISQYPNYLMFNGALFFVGMCFEKLISRHEALGFLRGWIFVTLRKAGHAA